VQRITAVKHGLVVPNFSFHFRVSFKRDGLGAGLQKPSAVSYQPSGKPFTRKDREDFVKRVTAIFLTADG
jgi:hypothetical protein